MVAHSMELDELLFSSFFMDHGNNNELKEISSNLAKIEIGGLAKIQFIKWNDKSYGLTLFDSAGKGVQLVVARTADTGEANITAYNTSQ